jgi:hypothetical protein
MAMHNRRHLAKSKALSLHGHTGFAALAGRQERSVFRGKRNAGLQSVSSGATLAGSVATGSGFNCVSFTGTFRNHLFLNKNL